MNETQDEHLSHSFNFPPNLGHSLKSGTLGIRGCLKKLSAGQASEASKGR